MLSPHTDSRPSTDRSPVDNYQHGYPQHNYQPSNIPPNATYAPRPNGFGPVSPPRQRNGDNSTSRPNHPNSNGPLPPNSESSAMSDRNGPQQNSNRDRSQPRANSSAKRSRICAECGQQLTGQFVRALDGTYHLECFTCRVSNDLT